MTSSTGPQSQMLSQDAEIAAQLILASIPKFTVKQPPPFLPSSMDLGSCLTFLSFSSSSAVPVPVFHTGHGQAPVRVQSTRAQDSWERDGRPSISRCLLFKGKNEEQAH